MDKFYHECEELILEMKNIHVGKSNLVEDDASEVYSCEEGWKEVEFF